MHAELEYVENSDIYNAIIEDGVMKAKKSIWIATANVKNMRVRHKKRVISVVALFERLVRHGIQIRILHGALPSKPFQGRLNRSRLLQNSPNFTMVHCPRVHMKTIIIDNIKAYMGSANLTGAGLGIKYETQRNFEIGIVVPRGPVFENLATFFQFLWKGEMCRDCSIRSLCPKPIK